jgi:hypothetical protein
MTIAIAGWPELLITLLRFAVGIATAHAGYHLLAYVQARWRKR